MFVEVDGLYDVVYVFWECEDGLFEYFVLFVDEC